MIAGTIAVVILTIALGVLVDRKWPILPRRKDLATPRPLSAPHGAGEAPETALRASVPQLARLKTSQRCSGCRASMQCDREDTVRYDARELTVLALRCPRCGAARGLYVDVRPRG